MLTVTIIAARERGEKTTVLLQRDYLGPVYHAVIWGKDVTVTGRIDPAPLPQK